MKYIDRCKNPDCGEYPGRAVIIIEDVLGAKDVSLVWTCKHCKKQNTLRWRGW